MIKIALDAGHGLNTAGKQTPDGIKEWTLNDKVRDKVVQLLKDYDCEIIHTDNNEGNVDETLASRVQRYINAGADVFVSIHHNAFNNKWNNATGVEVFTDKNPTAADSRLAECIYKNLPKYTGLKGRGIKAENWWVINQNRIPAVLVEGGFMDSKIDHPVITSENGQDGYARAVAEGLIEFLGLKKKVTPGWKQDNKGWRYQNADGTYPKNEWLKLDAWYCFDKNGYAVQSAWAKVKGKWYYFDKSCRMVTGLKTIGGKLYYLANDGHLCYTNSKGELK
ncbi:MAG: N-acetylmuramoyl-L-alanine amidase [Clostridia bacterium]|nr:N-acetylmuramoyl-L-alanine amidase [Clostridia bacterium]